MRTFTLQYWQDDGWFVGRLREAPNVFSQGKTYNELIENIIDVYRMIVEDSTETVPKRDFQTAEVSIPA